MPLEGDRRKMADLTTFNILEFAKALSSLGGTPIRGINKFINDIKNGRRLGNSADKFYNNILSSVSSIKTEDNPDIGIRISETLGRSIEKAREYFADIEMEDPIKYHGSHLIPPDLAEFERFASDVTSSFRRILELRKISNKSLSLPVLKDQYNLAFERVYKPVRSLLYKLMNDGHISKNLLNERIENILCFEHCFGKLKDSKSDVRIIRNLFAHPDRIDRYDYYQINLEIGVLKLYPDDLMYLNTLLVDKLMLLTHLSDIILDLEIYKRVFET